MSNVCRYFLNNTCRYGNRCRFSHNVSDSGSITSGSSNPYVYIRDQSASPPNSRQTLSNSDIREIIERISEEAKQVEYEHMWPLTCLSVIKDAPNVPGWEDFSMEEIRAAAYASKASGRLDEYLDFYKSLLQKAKENREIFIRPGKQAENKVKCMFIKHNQETPQPNTSAPFSSPSKSFSFNSAQIPAFGGRPTSTFGSAGSFNTSGFGSQPSSTPFMTSSPFGSASANKDPSAGIFAMAARGFNPSSFNQSQNSSKNDTAMETATDISLSQSATSPFLDNIFGQVPQLPSSGGPFNGTAPSGFGSSSAPTGFSSFGAPAASPPPTLVHLNAVFTPMDDLTEMEIEQFKATTFTLEKLPLRPPPRELC